MASSENTGPALPRRALLAGAGGAATFVALGPSPASAAPSGPASKGAQNLAQSPLRSFLMMRTATDDRLAVGVLSGRYNGVVDGQVTPLVGVVAATFTRSRPAPGGGYEFVSYEQAYFTSLETGKALERWKNPYTGEEVDVPIASQSLTSSHLGPDLKFVQNKIPPGVRFDQFINPAEIMGDEAFFLEEIRVETPASAKGPVFRYTEATILRAKLADLAETSGRVPCQVQYNALISWRPWMKMGDRPGCLSGFGHGSLGVSAAEAAPAWLDATARAKPELLKTPQSVLDPLWRG